MDSQLYAFIPMLRCPVSGQSLHPVSAAELDALNRAVVAGNVYTSQGSMVKQPLQSALMSADKAYVYPVLEGFIPALLVNMAIPFKEQQGEEKRQHTLSVEKKAVQEFYDEFGWKKEAEGYKDTLTFEDRRPVADQYWKRCHLRLNKYLPGGDYLLDVASGSIPNDEYLTYHRYYRLRICMDFSILALKEASLRLKGKGIFILGDITNIPLRENCIDGLISMHTVYHVPLGEQTKAVEETYRVLSDKGQAVIVYSWKKAGLMRLAFSLWKPVLTAYKWLKGEKKIQQPFRSDERPDLFVQQQNHDWFVREVRRRFNARLRVYSAISRSFSNTFIREKAFGRQLSGIIYFLENAFPKLMGRWGQYPVFIIRKAENAASKNPGLKMNRGSFALPVAGSSQEGEKQVIS